MTDTTEGKWSAELIEGMLHHSNLAQAVTSGGMVWTTSELQDDFIVHGFFAPWVTVTRKWDGREGSMTFTHHPRFYFDFVPKS